MTPIKVRINIKTQDLSKVSLLMVSTDDFFIVICCDFISSNDPGYQCIIFHSISIDVNSTEYHFMVYYDDDKVLSKIH